MSSVAPSFSGSPFNLSAYMACVNDFESEFAQLGLRSYSNTAYESCSAVAENPLDLAAYLQCQRLLHDTSSGLYVGPTTPAALHAQTHYVCTSASTLPMGWGEGGI